MKKYLIILLTIILVITGCGKNKDDKKVKKESSNFTINMIKSSFKEENYLISPYSIEIALNMLKEGANGNTLKEIEKVLSDRKISDVSIKKRVNVANALFIKDDYKNVIKKSFKNALVNDYNSEVLYDEFKTPVVINNWVNNKTDGMIKKVVDNIDEDFVLGLANAIAVDVDWAIPFDCTSTRKEQFTKANGKKYDVQMMHDNYKTNKVKYVENDDAIGIILPYQSYDPSTGDLTYENGKNLEFVAILPKDSDVKTYINNLTDNSLKELLKTSKAASNDLEIQLSLPRFTYEYEIEKFSNILENMGIKDAFNSKNADFTNIMDKKDMKDKNLYVSTAVHKTYIELNEKGTKAAAVTFFGVDATSALPQEPKKIVKIKFDKPFIYMIKDKDSNEILFFGAVFEPNVWNGSSCGI